MDMSQNCGYDFKENKPPKWRPPFDTERASVERFRTPYLINHL